MVLIKIFYSSRLPSGAEKELKSIITKEIELLCPGTGTTWSQHELGQKKVEPPILFIECAWPHRTPSSLYGLADKIAEIAHNYLVTKGAKGTLEIVVHFFRTMQIPTIGPNLDNQGYINLMR